MSCPRSGPKDSLSGAVVYQRMRLWRVGCRFRNGAPVISIVRTARTGLGAIPEAQVGSRLGQAVRSFRSPI
jgi:hypothetical protein